MKLELGFESGMSEDPGYEKPSAPAGLETTHAEICLVKKHLVQVQNLKPGMKVTVTLRGVVEEISQEAGEGAGGTTGELCLIVSEFSASRGSTFEDLLDD